MELERNTYKIKLTTGEAETVLRVVNDIHDDNTGCLTGANGYHAFGTERDAIKAESAALRRVRDALRRKLTKEV